MMYRWNRLLQWSVSVLCYGVIALFLFFPHPVFSRIPPLIHGSGAIQERILQGVQRLKLLSWLDQGVPWAIAGIFLSLLYIVIYVLSGKTDQYLQSDGADRSSAGYDGLYLLISSLTGYLIGCLYLWFRHEDDLFGFYLVLFLVTGSLAWTYYGWRFYRDGLNKNRSSTHSLTRIWLLAPGLLLIGLVTPLDSFLHYIDRGAFLPDVWLPIIHSYVLNPLQLIPLTIGLILVLTAVERIRPSETGTFSFLRLAPAYIFLLGPASPAKGLAVAFLMDRFGRNGLHWSVRVGFVVMLQVPVLLIVEFY